MKWILGLFSLVVLAACSKPVAQDESTPATPTPAPVAAATPTPAPTPAQVAVVPHNAATPQPSTPAPELAPPGVFYLLVAVRVETDSGVTGLPPGTGVRLLHDDLYQTPAGEAHIAEGQVTNDMALARKAKSADAATQAAAQARIAADGKTIAERQRADANYKPTAQQVANKNAQDQQELRTRIATLQAQYQAVATQRDALAQKQGYENYRKATGHIVSSTSGQQVQALDGQLQTIQAEVNRLSGMLR